MQVSGHSCFSVGERGGVGVLLVSLLTITTGKGLDRKIYIKKNLLPARDEKGGGAVGFSCCYGDTTLESNTAVGLQHRLQAVCLFYS